MRPFDRRKQLNMQANLSQLDLKQNIIYLTREWHQFWSHKSNKLIVKKINYIIHNTIMTSTGRILLVLLKLDAESRQISTQISIIHSV